MRSRELQERQRLREERAAQAQLSAGEGPAAEPSSADGEQPSLQEPQGSQPPPESAGSAQAVGSAASKADDDLDALD